MSINIEIDQQQMQTPTSTHELPPPSYDQWASEFTTQTLQSDPSNNNLDSGVNNNSAPQSQQQRDVAIDVDARFGQSCAPILSEAQIVNDIIEASIRLDRRRWLYLFIGCIPPFVVMSAVWITWAAMNSLSIIEKQTEVVAIFALGIPFASLTGIILIWAFYYGARNYSNRRKYTLLQSNVRHLIKLEGDQWIRYVEYLYGSKRIGFWNFGAIGAVTFRCCRKSHYKELIERGYGYIVLCQQGSILDEMGFVVRDQTHTVLAVTYVIGMGLRVYLLRKNAKYAVRQSASEAERQRVAQAALKQQTMPLDIYLPNIPQNLAVLLGLQIQHGL